MPHVGALSQQYRTSRVWAVDVAVAIATYEVIENPILTLNGGIDAGNGAICIIRERCNCLEGNLNIFALVGQPYRACWSSWAWVCLWLSTGRRRSSRTSVASARRAIPKAVRSATIASIISLTELMSSSIRASWSLPLVIMTNVLKVFILSHVNKKNSIILELLLC